MAMPRSQCSNRLASRRLCSLSSASSRVSWTQSSASAGPATRRHRRVSSATCGVTSAANAARSPPTASRTSASSPLAPLTSADAPSRSRTERGPNLVGVEHLPAHELPRQRVDELPVGGLLQAGAHAGPLRFNDGTRVGFVHADLGGAADGLLSVDLAAGPDDVLGRTVDRGGDLAGDQERDQLTQRFLLV